MNLDLLLKSERKYEISKDTLYPLKHYMDTFKEKLKVEFACISVDDAIAWCNVEWTDIDVIDRVLFNIIIKLYSGNDICEIPIYFAKTALEDDLTGKV